MRRTNGDRGESLTGPNSPGGPISSSWKFLDLASDRSTHTLLPLGASVPGHSCPDPSVSVTSRPASMHVSQLFSVLFGSLLPGKNCPPKRKPSSSERASGTPSLEDEGGRVGSLSRGHSQKVVAGSTLWLLLPGVRNPTPFKDFVEKTNFLKFLNPVFPSPNDI